MDELKETITHLRDLLTQHLEEGHDNKRHGEIGAHIRDQVLRLLRRKDLRITTEVMLHDLRNSFSGFETQEPENQRLTVEETLRIIENLDALMAAEQAFNFERFDLPEPPPSMVTLVKAKIQEIKQKEREKKDRLKIEYSKVRSPRRNISRRPKKPGAPFSEKIDESRSELTFEGPVVNAKPVMQPKRDEQPGMRRPPERATRPITIEEKTPGDVKKIDDGGDKRKTRRGGRRRSRRPLKK